MTFGLGEHPQTAFTLREARHADSTALADIKRREEDALYHGYGTPEEHARGLVEFCSPGYIASLFDRSDTTVSVAITSRPVGLGAITLDTPAARIHALHVEMKGAGVGTALTSNLAQIAEAHGCTLLKCEVMEPNHNAMAFFSKIGFELNGRWRWSVTYSNVRLLELEVQPRSLRAVRRV